jgi:alpha-tubulin suppressor-like RCC1 family protein
MTNSRNIHFAPLRLRPVTVLLAMILAVAAGLSMQFVAHATDVTPNTSDNVAASISAGINYNCEIRGDGTIACWGNNDDEQASPPAGTFIQVSSGTIHTCAIKSDHTIVCWGDNSEGEASPPAGNFNQVSVGDLHSCAIKNDDTITCWGNNDDNQ